MNRRNFIRKAVGATTTATVIPVSPAAICLERVQRVPQPKELTLNPEHPDWNPDLLKRRVTEMAAEARRAGRKGAV